MTDICRQEVEDVTDTTTVQLASINLAESLSTYDALRQDYPFGCLLFGRDQSIATTDVLRTVREAMEAVQASKLQLVDLKRALRQRLTMEQYQMAFVELIKHENLHAVLKQLDSRKFEKRETIKTVQEMIITTIESPNAKAVVSRAVVATAGSAIFDGAVNGISGFGSAGFASCAVSNVVMFSIFTAVELYRWSKGLDGREVAKNIGEHAVGALAGSGGALGGFKVGAIAGAAIGTAVPVIGNLLGAAVGGVIGSLIGGLLFDGLGRLLYRKLAPRVKKEATEKEVIEEHEFTPRELVEKAASKFGIDIDSDSFEEAHSRFRRRLLAKHPDKHPNVSAEEREKLTAETTDILACWLIVREFYNDRGDVAKSDCEEGFIKTFALKVLDRATQQWRTVRTFFDFASLGRDLDAATERLEQVMIYI